MILSRLQFTPAHSHISTGADVKKTLPMVVIFLASTGLMAITGSLFIVFLWLLNWYITSKIAGKAKAERFLMFLLCLWFLYPEASLDYLNFHHRDFVQGVFLILFYFICRKDIIQTFKQFKFVKIIIGIWVLWGLLAYLPVLFASVVKFGLAERLPEYLEKLAAPTTLMKTTVYFIPNALAILVPILALKELDNLRVFIKIVFILTLLVIAGAFATYLLNISFVNQDHSMSSTISDRMFTFSALHPNNFGRLLLLPLILFISLSFKKLRPRWIIVLSLGIFCMLLTFSRTTYVSISIGVLMIFIVNSLRMRGVFMSILLGIMIVAFVSSLGLPELFQTDTRLSSRANLDGRFYLQRTALKIVANNPYFGAHPGGYRQAMRGHGFSENRRLASPHNMFLGIAVEWGVPMAIIVFIALMASIWNGFKVLKKLAGDSRKNNEFIKAFAVFCIALAVSYLAHGSMEIVAPELVFFLSGVSFALVALTKKYA